MRRRLNSLIVIWSDLLVNPVTRFLLGLHLILHQGSSQRPGDLLRKTVEWFLRIKAVPVSYISCKVFLVSV